MAPRFLAFALAAFLLTFAVLATAINAKSAYAADDLWYVGEGARQDTYVKYQIQEFDTADRQPFMLTIYFQERDSDGKWVAPTWIEYDNHVYKGTLKLGSNLARLAGGSGVPGEMNQFLGGYDRSLEWLGAFTLQEQPKSLNDSSWGKLCNGCEEIKPRSKESVTLPAGTYNTTLVGWHSGLVDNKIWILNEFPYPVKAQTYVDGTVGTPPTLFKFDLMEIGNGEPLIKAATDEALKSPIERQTTSGRYMIKLEWDSDIRPNTETSFGITFSDKTHFPLQDVDYDLTIKDVTGKVIEQLKNKKTDVAGIDAIPVKFNSSGPATISLKINSIEGQATGQIIESADFGVVVVPEFPVSAAIVTAAVIGLVVMITRVRGTGEFGIKSTFL